MRKNDYDCPTEQMYFLQHTRRRMLRNLVKIGNLVKLIRVY